jgi:hypothetical protein
MNLKDVRGKGHNLLHQRLTGDFQEDQANRNPDKSFPDENFSRNLPNNYR